LPAAGAGCGTNASYVTCPSALTAAQALTGNSSQLLITNAKYTGSCTLNKAPGMILVTNFTCHYLGSSMPLGAMTHAFRCCFRMQNTAITSSTVLPQLISSSRRQLSFHA